MLRWLCTTHHCADKIDEDNKSHGETTESAKVAEENELAEIVHGRVNPSPTLREQDFELVRCYRMGDSVWSELHLEGWEVLHHDGRKVTILAQVKQILLVQRVDVHFRLVINDAIGDDEWSTFVRGANAIHAEATGKARHGSKERFECLGQMMGDIVLVHLTPNMHERTA